MTTLQDGALLIVGVPWPEVLDCPGFFIERNRDLRICCDLRRRGRRPLDRKPVPFGAPEND